MSIAIEPHDPFLWLEGIHDPDALAWATAQTDATLAEFASPQFDALTGRLLEVIDSDERIPVVSKRGDFYYNFWRDSSHPRGLWRRTTLESYRSASVEWDVLLDIDALGRAEDTEWVFAGSKVLPKDKVPADESGRALVSLSPDGGDAVTVREFDLDSRQFVTDGFVVPTAKTIISWIDRDTVYVGTDFGPGSMTTSSYARTARRWHRGQALAEAELVHEVAETDLEVVASHIHTPGFERDLVIEVLDFYRSRTLLLVEGEYVLLDLPEDSDVDIRRDRLLVHPRSAWGVYPSGSLLSISLDAFLAGDRDFETVFTADAHTALESWDWTDDSLILTVLEDVASKLVRVIPPSGAADDAGWTHTGIEGLPALSTLRVIDTDSDHSNEFWVHATGFTTPATVLRGVLGTATTDGVAPEVIKSMPSLYDDGRFTVQQHWAVSADGTRIPYFQVAETGIVLDGSHPTLLSGYGGFQSSVLPDYTALVGRGWLERGGVYVRANIRGGGEFGPDWHTAALKQNRPRAYEDFAAVAKDLVARGVTTADRLGAEGRSNGGLLVGNMLTTYPELFGAIVCGVPLLDMRRYTKLSAGASWIAEYGDPDIEEEWEFIRTFSPYHLLQEGVDYPATLFYAATSDDRVGPVQARKMAALMQSMAIPGIRYFENADGGHGGAVDNTHTARLQALIYEFLWRQLAH